MRTFNIQLSLEEQRQLKNALGYFRISPDPSSTIPFTGDRQTDADIIAFIRARKNLLHKKGNLY